MMHPASSPYGRRRFLSEIISHTVWLYFRFALSYRDVEEIMAVRGVTLSYETIRNWCRKFGFRCKDDLETRKVIE
jgi:putative transposase